MEVQNNNYTHAPGRAEAMTSIFMSMVYRWMTLGVALTAFVAYLIASDQEILYTVATNNVLLFGCLMAEFALVIYLRVRLQKMSALASIIAFLTYAALNGVTFSIFSMIYTGASIQNAFVAAACSFAGLSFFGYVTKKDLGPVGTFCHMGLWGIIIFSLISMFVPSMRGGQMDMVFSMVGILVFAGLTAYDTQKIKAMAPYQTEGSEMATKSAIMGALALYLDFINLFLFLLRFMGKRK